MKTLITSLGLTATILLLSGCVTRTYTDETQHRGARERQGYGSSGDYEEKSSKRIWFWQKAFRNP